MPVQRKLSFCYIDAADEKSDKSIWRLFNIRCTRVSTRNQKDDLQNQVAFLRQFCNAKGIIVDQCIEDYGSGLNYNRKKWNELLDEVMEQKIKTSCRILFQYSMCSLAGCTDFVSIKNK